jgi:CBS domain-containing protein
MLTDRDVVLRCTAPGLDPKSVIIRDIMTRGVVTTSPDIDVDAAARQMSGDQVRRLPVVTDGRLVGMLSLCDMARHCDMEAAAALADISANVSRKRAKK